MAEPRNDLRLWHAVVELVHAIRAVMSYGYGGEPVQRSRYQIARHVGALVCTCFYVTDPGSLNAKMRKEVDIIVQEAKEGPSR